MYLYLPSGLPGTCYMSAISTGIKMVCGLEISNDSHHLANMYMYISLLLKKLILAAPKAAAKNTTL
jgi:hypothetical protein